MANFIRRQVSLKKKRFEDKEEGYDLDLTYILPNIIATGFPSVGMEAIIRNPRTEVQRLLDTRHKDHYYLWNLCSERSYEPSEFHMRVNHEFRFDDHQAPPFQMMEPFCKTVSDWLLADEANVAVIHCKAGKGRTGTMICSYLVYSKQQPSAQAAMDFYAVTRTYDGKGVNIPCQRRYVHYFEEYLRLGSKTPYPNQALGVRSIRFGPIPAKGMNITFHLKLQTGQIIYDSRRVPNARKYKREEEFVIIDEDLVENIPVLQGDIQFDFRDRDKKKFQYWINTEFIDHSKPLILRKTELDTMWKDNRHKKFAPDFFCELIFSQEKPRDKRVSTVAVGSNSNASSNTPRMSTRFFGSVLGSSSSSSPNNIN